jgi:hypothetical protein
MLHHPLVDELAECFVVRHGHVNAQKEMAAELLQAMARIVWLERRLEREERDVSAGYLRRTPSHRARQPKPPLADPVTDDWVRTGAAGDAS